MARNRKGRLFDTLFGESADAAGAGSCGAVISQFQSHANYEIFYFHNGKGNYLIGDKIYALTPGDLIIMHGMTLHCPSMGGGSPYIRSLINIDPAYIRAVSGPLFSFNLLEPFERLRNYRFHLQGGQREEVEELLARMNRFNRPSDPLAREGSVSHLSNYCC